MATLNEYIKPICEDKDLIRVQMRVHQQVNYKGNSKSVWFSEHFGFPGGTDGSLPAVRETGVRSLGLEDPLEEKMAPHPSIVAWRIP